MQERPEVGSQSEQLNPFEIIPDREQRLEAINQFLKERNLRPLKSVGNWEDPNVGTELFEIRQVYERPLPRFYAVVTFGARFFAGAEGKYNEGEYNIIFKANGAVADGSVYITRIATADEKVMYLLVDQYRIPHNERMTELVRGFARGDDVELAEGESVEAVDLIREAREITIPAVRALREIREEAGIKRVKRIKHLGKIPEDSSVLASDINVYLVDAESQLAEQELEASELGTVRVIMTPTEIYGGFQEGKIRDMHSLAAFFTAILKDTEEGQRFAKFLLAK